MPYVRTFQSKQTNQLKPMSYTVYITETSHTSVSFGTKEEAEAFMKEPDYDLCDSWELSDSNIELVEENDWPSLFYWHITSSKATLDVL